MSNLCIIVTIVVYLAAMLLVGFAYSKSNNDSTDFYLGGRKMGPLVTAMSAEASDMSSWLLMGMPCFVFPFLTLTGFCRILRTGTCGKSPFCHRFLCIFYLVSRTTASYARSFLAPAAAPLCG